MGERIVHANNRGRPAEPRLLQLWTLDFALIGPKRLTANEALAPALAQRWKLETDATILAALRVVRGRLGG